MYSIPHTTSSKTIGTGFDEHKWVSQVRRTLEEELDDEDDVPVSIFNVPKVLMATNPDSYTPQEVAIGPYHYRRVDLYEMERYKLSAAKRLRQKCKFDDIVKQLINHEVRIRASYHKYLPLSGETLAWMMAIDAAFLLEFLFVAVKQGKQVELTRLSSRMSHLLDYTGQKSAHNAVMRDLVMLENQIPLFVLRGLLEFRFPTLDEADDMLHSMLLGFCQVMSPFKMIDDASVSDSPHMLDFLYRLVTPKIEVAHHEVSINAMEINHDELGQDQDGNIKKEPTLSSYWKILVCIWGILKKLNDLNGPIIKLLRRLLLVFKPLISFVLKYPMKILAKIPGLKLLKAPLEMLLFPRNKEETKPDENAEATKPPRIEEIAIPSVTELAKSGVIFCPTNGDISTIAFDSQTATFHLPTISLDVNTGTILRNLVAYEASSASGPLVLTRFTELINGIVDVEDDVRLLRESGIILNRLKSDDEVANLCNGMSKSIRLTKVPFLDKVIEDVNKYYEGGFRVKYGRFMKRYVFGSWKLLTLLATVMMLLLMGLQSVCSVYTCTGLLDRIQDDPTFLIH